MNGIDTKVDKYNTKLKQKYLFMSHFYIYINYWLLIEYLFIHFFLILAISVIYRSWMWTSITFSHFL